jgi:hypothetical protein
MPRYFKYSEAHDNFLFVGEAAPVRARIDRVRWATNNPERWKELKRQSHARHKDAINARGRAKRLALSPEDRASLKERSRQQYVENHDARIATQRARRAADPEKFRNYMRKHKAANPYLWLLYDIQKRSKRMGTPCDLTVEWIETKFAGVCELSGLPFDKATPAHFSTRRPNAPSVDRIKPGGPYTQENCRVILWSLNRALGNYGDDYMCAIFEHVLARRKAGP